MAKGNGGTRLSTPGSPNGMGTVAINGASFEVNGSTIETQNKNTRLIAKIAARFPNGGQVIKYNVGSYNENDIKDLEIIAKDRAGKKGVTVQILPAIDNPKNPNYAKLFPELIGTEYEGKCPDLRIVTQKGDKMLVEYESYGRPYRSKKIYKMLSRGAEQAPRIIIDTRDMRVSDNYLRNKVIDLLNQKTFTKKIVEVSRYDGKTIKRVYG